MGDATAESLSAERPPNGAAKGEKRRPRRLNGPVNSPGAPTLILIPTQGEWARLQALGGLPPEAGILCRSGFGPVAAAARTAQLLATLAPRRVLLLGIAGTFDPARLPVGSAALFGSVELEGVGAGSLESSALGFEQWDGVGERLELEGPPENHLLSVCRATRGEAQLAERRRRGALAEEMEAFGVALACHLAGTPLAVIRGASNPVGESDRGSWKIDQALAAARDLALAELEGGGE